MKAWLSIKDVCDELGIHRATWHRWVSDEAMGTPKPITGIGRLVRYPRDQFEAFLKSLEGLSVGPETRDPQNNDKLQRVGAK